MLTRLSFLYLTYANKWYCSITCNLRESSVPFLYGLEIGLYLSELYRLTLRMTRSGESARGLAGVAFDPVVGQHLTQPNGFCPSVGFVNSKPPWSSRNSFSRLSS